VEDGKENMRDREMMVMMMMMRCDEKERWAERMKSKMNEREIASGIMTC
jgi:hypothetical protein